MKKFTTILISALCVLSIHCAALAAEKPEVFDSFWGMNSQITIASTQKEEDSFIDDRYYIMDATGNLLFQAPDNWYLKGFRSGIDSNNIDMVYINDLLLFHEYKDKTLIRQVFVDRNGSIEFTSVDVISNLIDMGYSNITQFEMSHFSEGLALFYVGTDNADVVYGYIGIDGTIVLPPIYEWAQDFSEGLAAVVVDGYLGFIDSLGNTVIENVWQPVGWSYSAKDNDVIIDKYPYSSTFLHWLIEPIYTVDPNKVVNFKDKLARVVGMYQGAQVPVFIDKTGTVVAEYRPLPEGMEEEDNVLGAPNELNPYIFRYSMDGSFHNKLGLMRSDGLILTEPVYDDIFDFKDGYATVVQDGMKGVVDVNGNVIIPPVYTSMDYDNGLSDGYLIAGGENGGVIVDINNNIVTPTKYEYIISYGSGMAQAKLGDWYGFIDMSGRRVFEYKSGTRTIYSEGLVVLYEDTKVAGEYWDIPLPVRVADKSGNTVFTIDASQWHDVGEFHDGVAWVAKYGSGIRTRPSAGVTYGYINTSGQLVSDF